MNTELQTRPEAGDRILQTCQYVVGKDIAQGIYELGFVAAEEDDTYTNWYVYDTKQLLVIFPAASALAACICTLL